LTHGLIAKPAVFWLIMRFAGAASPMTHTLLFLAGVLLGKTSLDWLYGLRGGLPNTVPRFWRPRFGRTRVLRAAPN